MFLDIYITFTQYICSRFFRGRLQLLPLLSFIVPWLITSLDHHRLPRLRPDTSTLCSNVLARSFSCRSSLHLQHTASTVSKESGSILPACHRCVGDFQMHIPILWLSELWAGVTYIKHYGQSIYIIQYTYKKRSSFRRLLSKQRNARQLEPPLLRRQLGQRSRRRFVRQRSRLYFVRRLGLASDRVSFQFGVRRHGRLVLQR